MFSHLLSHTDDVTYFISLQYAEFIRIGWWSLWIALVNVINVSQNFQCADVPAGLRMTLVLDDTYDCANVWFLILQLNGIFAFYNFFYNFKDCCYNILSALFQVELDCKWRMRIESAYNVGDLYIVLLFSCWSTWMFSCVGIIIMLVIVVGYEFWCLIMAVTVVVNYVSQNFQCADALAGLRLS